MPSDGASAGELNGQCSECEWRAGLLGFAYETQQSWQGCAEVAAHKLELLERTQMSLMAEMTHRENIHAAVIAAAEEQHAVERTDMEDQLAAAAVREKALQAALARMHRLLKDTAATAAHYIDYIETDNRELRREHSVLHGRADLLAEANTVLHFQYVARQTELETLEESLMYNQASNDQLQEQVATLQRGRDEDVLLQNEHPPTILPSKDENGSGPPKVVDSTRSELRAIVAELELLSHDAEAARAAVSVETAAREDLAARLVETERSLNQEYELRSMIQSELAAVRSEVNQIIESGKLIQGTSQTKVQDLEKQLEQAMEAKATGEQAHAALQECMTTISELESELQCTRNEFDAERESLSEEIECRVEELRFLTATLEQNGVALVDCQDRVLALERELSTNRGQLERLRTDLTETKDGLKRAREQHAHAKKQVSVIKAEHKVAREQHEKAMAASDRTEDALRGELASLGDELAEHLDAVQEKDEKIAQLEADNGGLQRKLNALIHKFKEVQRAQSSVASKSSGRSKEAAVNSAETRIPATAATAQTQHTAVQQQPDVVDLKPQLQPKIAVDKPRSKSSARPSANRRRKSMLESTLAAMDVHQSDPKRRTPPQGKATAAKKLTVLTPSNVNVSSKPLAGDKKALRGLMDDGQRITPDSNLNDEAGDCGVQ